MRIRRGPATVRDFATDDSSSFADQVCSRSTGAFGAGKASQTVSSQETVPVHSRTEPPRGRGAGSNATSPTPGALSFAPSPLSIEPGRVSCFWTPVWPAMFVERHDRSAPRRARWRSCSWHRVRPHRCRANCAAASPTRRPGAPSPARASRSPTAPSSARAEADGSFVLRGLEPQTYTVTVRAVGYSPLRRDVEIENGRTATLDASLTPTPAQLSTVVSSARRNDADRNAVTFDRAAIEASGRHDVGELLSAVPGLVVTRSGGPGQPTQASIRGSSAAEVLVVVDGVVANSPLTGVADLSQLSLATVERVTVLEGAQSSRFGGRALAGAIVVETRRAAGEGSLSMDAGSWGERAIGGSIGDAAHSGSGPERAGFRRASHDSGGLHVRRAGGSRRRHGESRQRRRVDDEPARRRRLRRRRSEPCAFAPIGIRRIEASLAASCNRR